VAGLSDTLRVPLVMRELDEMSYEEIAAALGLSLSAVKMRILRARQELRAALEAAHG
jgi:RNA polymerase sigma-70 factor (ECF subfamily)